MARFDKYDGMTGGFRAKLNAALTSANVGKVYGVSLNTSGRVVIGGTAAADVVGVICPTKAMAAGDTIDVMTSGEIEEFVYTAGGAAAAGDRAYSATTGDLSTTNTGKLLGRVVPSGSGTGMRLVVRSALA